MRKIIFSAFVLLMAMVSCQKNTVPEQAESRAIPMTLTATIGGDDTKISFEDVDNVLKTAWEQYDKVSVISLDVSGNILTNDIFTVTSPSPGKKAEFEGAFTNDPETKSVWIYYPALTEGEGTAEDPWQVPAANDYDEHGVLYELVQGTPYTHYNSRTQLQIAANSHSNLEQYVVLSGEADLQNLAEAKLDANLFYCSYILKVSVKLPKAGIGVRSLTISAYTSDGDNSVSVSGSGWACINEPENFPGGSNSAWMICFGDKVEYGIGTGVKFPTDEFTTYIVGYAGKSWNYIAQDTQSYRLTEGDYLKFTLDALDDQGNIYPCGLDKKNITKTTIFENGKMYRISATLQEEATE